MTVQILVYNYQRHRPFRKTVNIRICMYMTGKMSYGHIMLVM